VPSSEGLVINLDTSMIFHLNPQKAAEVYQKIGPNYIAVLIEPNLRAAIRNPRRLIQPTRLHRRTRNGGEADFGSAYFAPGNTGICRGSILLRDIQLPATLKASIEAKQQAEQEALAMSFRLQKEKQEAERKRIEAQGIRDFQQIVPRASASAAGVERH